ncbi:hypothetical protein [Saliphagus sp. LR7]|uniref:hypothetical protein n=1 Tax=Saliphagus sp. LR7 TaxID=2282654 RepID=UPI000DF852BF|nr:hypothetical protein [Saliphagus sp. LR7]
MGETIPIAVPRKGRPLEAVLGRLAGLAGAEELADGVISTLRHEKAITKGDLEPETDVYRRLADYSSSPEGPDYTLLRDDREGFPRRIVFDSAEILLEGERRIRLIGREEPFRALRTHEFALGFDSADLVLEEVVELGAGPVERIADLNARIDPTETDVRVAGGLGDTVYHTLMVTPETAPEAAPIDRAFLASYEGPLCIVPRYERLVRAVLGKRVLDGISFRYPEHGHEEEAAIAAHGAGVYLTVTGSTARDHGLVLGEELFPSETVLLENAAERRSSPAVEAVRNLIAPAPAETELVV